MVLASYVLLGYGTLCRRIGVAIRIPIRSAAASQVRFPAHMVGVSLFVDKWHRR